MVLGYALDDAGAVLWRLRDHGPVSVVAWFPGAFPGSMVVGAEGGTDGAVEFAVSAPADTGEGTTVWRSDGTEPGTVSLGTVPGRAELLHAGGAGTGGARFLRAYINGGLHELWSLTPTPEGGSRRLAGPFEEIPTWGWAAGADGSAGRLVFTARRAAVGAQGELWTSDGTRDGTRWLSGPSVPALRDAEVWCAEGGWVYLTATEPLSGSELWRTDGTEGGTARLSDIAPGPTSSLPHGAAVVNHRLYFGAVDEIGADGLWVVDLCPADFDNDGQVGVQDVLDYLAAFFAADPRADANGVDGVTLQDVVDWLILWARGC
jgi:ELWxxDGT repeat protein